MNVDFEKTYVTEDDKKQILKYVDHTLLKPTATWEDIKKVLCQAREHNCASACIPPCYLKKAKKFVDNKVKLCTVIGFPNGNMSTKSKCDETKNAIKDGANEIDMVINIGLVKEKYFHKVEKEISQIAKICHSKKNILLKVIIETCYLTENEIRTMCYIIARSGADYIKTSTGFANGGATKDVIRIIKEEVDILNKDEKLMKKYPYRKEIKIKVAGGIKNFEEAKEYLDMGVSRLGTSSLITE